MNPTAEMRAMDLISIFAAGSGHPCGTLSVMDIAAALYLNALNRVYVVMGNGEQQDGSIWEAAMAAGHHKLDNIAPLWM
jgi:transketolase